MRVSFREIISLLRLLLEHIRQKRKRKKNWTEVLSWRDLTRFEHKLSLQVSLEHFSSKPWLCYDSTWWICINEFASNLIRRAIQLPRHSPFKDFLTLTLRKIPGDEKSLYAKLGDCYANDHRMCFFFPWLFVSVCILGTHYLSDILSSGGSKQLYLLNPSVHTHTFTTHTVFTKEHELGR